MGRGRDVSPTGFRRALGQQGTLRVANPARFDLGVMRKLCRHAVDVKILEYFLIQTQELLWLEHAGSFAMREMMCRKRAGLSAYSSTKGV